MIILRRVALLQEVKCFMTKMSTRVMLTVQPDQRQIMNMILWKVELVKNKGMYYHVYVHF